MLGLLDSTSLIKWGLIGGALTGALIYWQVLEHDITNRDATIQKQQQTIGTLNAQLEDVVKVANDNATALSDANNRLTQELKAVQEEADRKLSEALRIAKLKSDISNAKPTNCPLPDAIRIAVDGLRVPGANPPAPGGN